MNKSIKPLANEIMELGSKYFVGPGDDGIFLELGQQAMNLALEWLKNVEKRKIHADISLPELATLFKEFNLPKSGAPVDNVFQECCEKILNNSVRVNNPRYIGHMTTAIPWFSVLVDVLITARY